MSTPLVSALREGCGYLEDEGWRQTAQLMTLAADEIERLTERVRELEIATLQAPEASNQNGIDIGSVAARR